MAAAKAADPPPSTTRSNGSRPAGVGAGFGWTTSSVPARYPAASTAARSWSSAICSGHSKRARPDRQDTDTEPAPTLASASPTWRAQSSLVMPSTSSTAARLCSLIDPLPFLVPPPLAQHILTTEYADRLSLAERGGDLQGIVEAGLSLEEGPERHELAGAAQRQGCAQSAAVAVEGNEPTVEVSVDDHHLVAGTRAAEHLDLLLVLVGPEVGHRVETRRSGPAGEQCLRRRCPHVGSHLPVLDPDLLAPEREAGHIAGPDHAVGREQRLVANHPIAKGQPGPLQPARLWHHPHPGHHHVGLEGGSVGQLEHGRAVPPHGRDAHAGAQRHPVVLVQPTEGGTDHLSHRWGQRDREGLDHRDPEPETSGGGRHLRTDEAGPDHHQVPLEASSRQRLPDRHAVLEGPQGQHAFLGKR